MTTPPIDPAPSSPARRARLDRRRFLILGGASFGLAACATRTDEASSRTTNTEATMASTTTSTTPSPSPTSTPGVLEVPTSVTESTTAGTPSAASALTAADFDSLGTCVLLSEKTAGPFPLDQQFDRRDVTEGYPGHPLRLGLRVVDATCEPVTGATVEIWHADATGDYSAFADGGGGKDEGTGTTFLRGSQTSGNDGIVEFQSLYPGWYRGRAVHIHLRVHLDATTVLTSQLFFDDDYTASVFATGEYASNGLPDTTNAQDSIAGNPAQEGSLLFLSPSTTTAGPGTLGLLNLGIDPSAVSAGGGGNGRGGPGGRGGRP